MVLSQEVIKWYSFNLNGNVYHNQINGFTVVNKYPVINTSTADKQQIVSGNVKLNNIFHLPKNFDGQLTVIFLAPDLIPQGKIGARFSLDIGLKKTIQKGRGELFLNATDIANTMKIKKEIQGNGFKYISTDYNETQVIRIGYSYKI